MTKKVFERLKIVAVALSLAGAAVGCSNASTDDSVDSGDVGSVGFNLTLPNGAKVDPITYVITGPTSKTGTIPTTGTGNTFSAKIDGLKPGTGYTIMLTGKQDNGAMDCFGSATFEVKVAQTTTVQVKLSCPGVRKTGSIMVNGTINICAVVESATGTPSGDGSTINLESSGTDDDMLPSNSISYKWTAPAGAGTFASDSAANTVFTCAIDGSVKLTLSDTDGDCGDKVDVDVICKKPGGGGSGGSGGSGTGTGGTGGTGTGGTGGVGSGGTGGDGSGGTGGTGTGGTGGTGTGGTGGVGSGGTGGDGSGGTGGVGSGGTGGTGTGGTGGVGSGGTGGDGSGGTGGTGTGGTGGTGTGGTGGTGTGGTGGTGTGGTGGGGADACRACELAADPDGACMGRVMAYESSPKLALGKALLDCVRMTKCSTISGAFSLIDCYCGTTDFAACSGGTMPGNGMCKAQVEAACETTAVATILTNITDTNYAAGLVNDLLACDDLGSCGATGTNVCSF